MDAGEPAFGLEDLAPELVVIAVLELLLGGWLDISVLINRIILAALDRISEDFGGLLDTLEEAVVLGVTSSSFLVGVVAKNFLAMGTLDLLFGGSPSVLCDTQNSIMILLLGTD